MSQNQLSTGAKLECLAYAVIATVALVGTQWALIEGIQSAEGSFAKQVWAELTANPTVVFAAIDLFMVALAAMIFIVVEGLRVRVRWWWLYLVLSLGIGISFGFPLFLLARRLRLAGQDLG
ncbi:MAG TPA: DUF2834 domain-containing protein [Aeromicrobium sp.]|nr:DUF2834 domain-containing protein [Aeromicrobium sp.]HKY58456.1 DUF2834 domain-containing protein [Aeromicrobium sp.]